MNLSFMPHLNASLNGLACVLLVIGRIQIKKQRIDLHKKYMISAAVTSGLFLVCYVIHYVWRTGIAGESHTPYHGTGWVKGFYYLLLLSHVVLAMTVPLIAVRLILLGFAQRYETHKRVARIGFPIWMYVSVTGILIYLMLYWFNPTP